LGTATGVGRGGRRGKKERSWKALAKAVSLERKKQKMV